MKRIRVPEELIEVLWTFLREKNGWESRNTDEGKRLRVQAEKICEIVLLHLSEHPQVPTIAQINAMYDDPKCPKEGTYLPYFLTEWQRRCFVQEESEIPEEIEDLLSSEEMRQDSSITWTKDGHDESVIEAYRRGLSAGLGLEVDAQGRPKGNLR